MGVTTIMMTAFMGITQVISSLIGNIRHPYSTLIYFWYYQTKYYMEA